jgi:L,D-transpeptidase ErfK/SrfK
MQLAGGCALGARAWHPLAQEVESAAIVGTMQRHVIRGDETLLDLTRRYDLGYVELVAANPGLDPWVPGAGAEVILPTAHVVPSGADDEGILINLAEQRLYFFRAGEGEPPLSFPIGVSREGWATPLGKTRVVRKRAAPIWYPTVSARQEDPSLPRAVAAGPENPLGDFALYLDWPAYLIHGTNEPDGVGRRVSRGCIRLYPEDIERLFEMTDVETPVRVVHEPVKLTRAGEDVFLEVHPTIGEMVEIEENARLAPIRPDDLRPRIRAVAGELSDRIDWRLAYRTAAERRGIPVRITTRTPSFWPR